MSAVSAHFLISAGQHLRFVLVIPLLMTSENVAYFQHFPYYCR